MNEAEGDYAPYLTACYFCKLNFQTQRKIANIIKIPQFFENFHEQTQKSKNKIHEIFHYFKMALKTGFIQFYSVTRNWI